MSFNNRMLLPQVKQLTGYVLQAVDNIASNCIDQMEPGRTSTLQMDDNVMLMSKNYVGMMANQSFSFSPVSGSDSGLTVIIRNTQESGELTSSDEVVGLRVST